MPEHIPTGLLIIGLVSLSAGWLMSTNSAPPRGVFGHADPPRAPKKPAAEVGSGSLFKPIADLLFFWIAKDFRYVIAYPALLFALNAAIADLLPNTYPSRVMRCDGDVGACLEIAAWRSWGGIALGGF